MYGDDDIEVMYFQVNMRDCGSIVKILHLLVLCNGVLI